MCWTILLCSVAQMTSIFCHLSTTNTRNLRGNEQLRSVENYYDKNTALFVALGEGKTSIHRNLYPPDQNLNVQQSIEYSMRLVINEVLQSPSCKQSMCQVLDLGCGAGGTVMWAASNYHDRINMTGITISSVQVALASKIARAASLGNAHFIHGSFEAFNDRAVSPSSQDGAIAIEAFVHTPHPALFFEQVSSRLVKGARLAIIDDFLMLDNFESDLGEAQIQRFQEGWQAASVISPKEAKDLADKAGLALIRDQDLTPMLHLWRPRDFFIHWTVWLLSFMPLTMSSAYYRSLWGGDALQVCLDRGYLNYRLLVFEKK